MAAVSHGHQARGRRLYAVTSDLSPRSNRTEESVARGCYYAATGDALTTLLDVLVSGRLRESAPHPYGFDVRTVIYLTTREGPTVPVVLGMEYSNAPIRGEYDHTAPIEARMGLGAALDEWEARHTLTSPTSESCTPRPLPTL